MTGRLSRSEDRELILSALLEGSSLSQIVDLLHTAGEVPFPRVYFEKGPALSDTITPFSANMTWDQHKSASDKAKRR